MELVVATECPQPSMAQWFRQLTGVALNDAQTVIAAGSQAQSLHLVRDETAIQFTDQAQ